MISEKNMGKQDVLRDAQDLIVIGKSGKDSYIYAVKPSLNVQRRFYEQSISNPADAAVPAFQRYWKFDEKEGITGSSTFLALRFDSGVLRPEGLWIPGLLEAKALESQGKLQNRVYRDCGIVVYSEGSPNKEIAEVLVPQARGLGFTLPLIVPYRALEPHAEGGEIRPSFVEVPQGVIHGKKAEKEIGSLDYRENSGVHGLGRGTGGDWDADWDNLGDSDDDGRVDWVCGEAHRKILEQVHSKLSERQYGERIKELRGQQKAESAKFRKSLKR